MANSSALPSVRSEVQARQLLQMAEPRKVQFVTLSTFAAGSATDSRKRRLEDAADVNLDGDGEVDATTATTGADGGGGRFGKTGDRDATDAKKITVRLDLSLSEPNDQASVEFNYGELVKHLQVRLLCVHGEGGDVWCEFILLPCFNCEGLVIVTEGGSPPCPSMNWEMTMRGVLQQKTRFTHSCGAALRTLVKYCNFGTKD